MYRDLTKGNITKTIILFVLPMMAGNLLQQFYNIADTLIVGRFLGSNALAAVGSAYTLMTFLTSILLGLSMGAGALFSIYQGQGDTQRLKAAVLHAFGLIFVIAAVLNVGVYLFIDPIMAFLHVPKQVYPLMRDYLWIIFAGVGAAFLYNFFCRTAAGHGKFFRPADFSEYLRMSEYRPGSAVRSRIRLGSEGGGRRDGYCTVCSRPGYHALYLYPL